MYQGSIYGGGNAGDSLAMLTHHKGITQGLSGGGSKTMFLKTLGIKWEMSAAKGSS